jgi:FKBP-type peptidyl-prolyl cis-trans isomerase 2
MALLAPVKALALIVFLAAIAGATYGVQRALGPQSLEGQLVSTQLVHETLNATPGHTVIFPVDIVNRGAASRAFIVGLQGDGAVGRSDLRSVAHEEHTVVFVPVVVSATASVGAHPLRLTVSGADGLVLRERVDAATLRVLGPAPGLAVGDTGEAIYLGRIAEVGSVFNTNDQAFASRSFPQTSTYRLSAGVLPLQTSPPNVVQGFFENVLGMQAGESRTFDVSPEKGYGNATDERREPREESLARAFALPLSDEKVARDAFNKYVTDTRQGNATQFKVGDHFVFHEQQTGNAWPYVIVAIDANETTYRLDVKVGETYTLYPFWANASRVESVNGTTALFLTTPGTQVGESFTARSYWPVMTALRSVNETVVVIRHSPPVGYKYTLPQGGQPIEITIREVTETEVVTSTPNPNPLAGKTLQFDVTLLALQKGAK